MLSCGNLMNNASDFNKIALEPYNKSFLQNFKITPQKQSIYDCFCVFLILFCACCIISKL